MNGIPHMKPLKKRLAIIQRRFTEKLYYVIVMIHLNLIFAIIL